MSSVELVHCTPDAERLIVKMARVSNQANEDNWESGPRLLRYLIKHKHWSPMEMASMCVKISTERDIAAQIIRHRSFSYQELSTRYTKTTAAIVPELRRQDTKNRQASHDDLDTNLKTDLQKRTSALLQQVYQLYEDMLEQGVAKESARRILPLCTPTTIYMQGSLRSWIHYLQVRCSEETQLEHREVANGCLKIFRDQFPVIADAAFDHDNS